MYLLKNAFISITRNKGRNILMGLIILVIASSCCLTLSIRESSKKLVNSYIDKYDIEATISFNRGNLMGNFESGRDNFQNNIEKFNEIEEISEEDIINYGDSDYVKDFYYTYSASLNSTTLEKATQEFNESDDMPFKREEFGSKNGRMEEGDFTVLGYSSFISMTDFIEGKYSIVEGEVDDDFESNSCVINQELALLNEISLGDTITLVDPSNENLTYDLVVTGIFTEQESDSDMVSMFSSSVNTIITNTKTLEEVKRQNSEFRMNLSPTFILKDKSVISKFQEEVSEKGLSEFYQVTTNLETIELGTKSIENVASFSTTFLVLVLIIGGIILFVLNMINVRERKYEIGVLRTIGMKKQYVIIQFVSELLMVALVSLLLGAGLGSIMSVGVSNQLLSHEIESVEEEKNQVTNNFGKGEFNHMKPGNEHSFTDISGIGQLEKITSIDAVVDFKILLELLGIGIVLTLFSSIASLVQISRFSPITILKERS